MKIFKMVSAALFAAVVTSINAQDSVPTEQNYADFGDTKTMVILDDNVMSDFNVKIKDVMSNEWKVTSYDFTTNKHFNSMISDPSYSFLTTTTVTYPEDKTKAKYIYLSLLMGKEKARKVNTLPDLLSIPLAYSNLQDQNYTYKLASFVRFILKHVELMKSNPKLISKTPLLYYNKNIKSLKNKTLYVVESEVQKDLRNEKAFGAVYKNKFKFVTEKEVMEAIENKAKDVVFLHKVGPGNNKLETRCYNMIIGADDDEVYYFDWHKVNKKEPDALTSKDLKKMSKQ
ncbi:MAG: hypothetical protein HUJ96_07240 [Marinilabiliaceae bacterium]|nr:hypothetical protein [Marinilabiliaceae bacterium]